MLHFLDKGCWIQGSFVATRWGVILSKVSSSDGTREFETISSEPQNCPHFHLIKPFDGEFDNLSYAYATLANRPMNLITYPMQPQLIVQPDYLCFSGYFCQSSLANCQWSSVNWFQIYRSPVSFLIHNVVHCPTSYLHSPPSKKARQQKFLSHLSSFDIPIYISQYEHYRHNHTGGLI